MEEREEASMRRIITFEHVSVDGYFADSLGKLDWVVQDDSVFRAAREGGLDPDTMLFGRKTYDMFEAYWPQALKDPEGAADPHHPEHRSEAVREMAAWINEATKIVFSRSRKQVTWQNSRLVPELSPQAVEEIRRQPGRDIIVFGSGSLATQLTRQGLVDEYLFVVSPVLLGRGRTLLDDVARARRLELREARQFESGIVLQRYARGRDLKP
jgi:dihydrofolate reductase